MTEVQQQSSRTASYKDSVTVIINPVSCNDGVSTIRDQISSIFSIYGCKPNFIETLETPPATVFAAEAVKNGANMIIAAGGDGTIMQAANALIDSPIPLGIIPLGTGNLLALNLGIPLDLESSIDLAMTGRERSIDLVRVNGGEHYFAIMGGLGFDARIMSDTDRSSKQRFGRIAYLWTALQNLEGHLFEANVQIDDKPPIRQEVKSILMANMGLIDPNLSVFPDASPYDGLLRVGLLKASTAPEFFHLVATAMAEGTPGPDPAFDYFSCRSVRIELTAPQPYEYDGDVQGEVSGLFAEIAPKALKIMSQPA